MLTNRQIERYSRQIIVSSFGGIAQERLLAARLVLAGEPHDLELLLYYLVGAGVSRIELPIAGDSPNSKRMITHAQALNHDVAVEPFGDRLDSPTLIMCLVGSGESLPLTQHLCSNLIPTPTIIARMDRPARIAIRGNVAPKEWCGLLLEPFAERVTNAGFVVMVAAMEALKLLVEASPPHQTRIIQFEGYSTRILPRYNNEKNSVAP